MAAPVHRGQIVISPIGGRLAHLLTACCVVLATACGSGTVPRRGGAVIPAAAPTGSTEAVRFYHAMGLAASAAPVPFVASAAHFAGSSPEAANTLLSMSIPSRALTFSRETDRYVAQYVVDLRVTRDGSELQRHDAHEFVRVGSFRETGRTDESVIFQRWLRLAPGRYTLRLSVRDVGSAGTSTDSLVIEVPRFAGSAARVSSPVPVYMAQTRVHLDSLPSLLARPRATAVFGRDSIVAVYAEGYSSSGAGRLPLGLSVRNDAGAIVWSDTASLPRVGSESLYGGTLQVPIAKVGMGVGFVSVVATGTSDTARTPYFVSFGEDLPVAPFDDMISYLRFFASAQRLAALRSAPPERRAQLWSDFLRDTDPVPTTPEHEALQAYFARIQLANTRFRDDIPAGWLSDRGNVYIALGDPDNAFEQTVTSSGGRRLPAPVRVQVWEYRQHRVQLTFTDENQTGRFKFLPRSEIEFRTLLQRVLVR
jgi:GWxTD domain-containing protein